MVASTLAALALRKFEAEHLILAVGNPSPVSASGERVAPPSPWALPPPPHALAAEGDGHDRPARPQEAAGRPRQVLDRDPYSGSPVGAGADGLLRGRLSPPRIDGEGRRPSGSAFP